MVHFILVWLIVFHFISSDCKYFSNRKNWNFVQSNSRIHTHICWMCIYINIEWLEYVSALFTNFGDVHSQISYFRTFSRIIINEGSFYIRFLYWIDKFSWIWVNQPRLHRCDVSFSFNKSYQPKFRKFKCHKRIINKQGTFYFTCLIKCALYTLVSLHTKNNSVLFEYEQINMIYG